MSASRQSQGRRRPKRTYGFIAGGTSAVMILALIYWTNLGLSGAWYLALTGVTWALFRFDKLQAQRRAGRTPEIILLALMAAGGFVGGGLGMYLGQRHKTNKWYFLATLALSALVHLAFWVLWPIINL